MKIKKILVLALAAVVSMSVAACQKGENTSEDPAKAEEEAVRKVAEEFAEARSKKVKDFDEIIENVEDFVDTDGELYEELEEGMKEMTDGAKGIGEIIGDKNGEEFTLLIYNTVAGKFEVEIKEVKVDGDEATVKADVTTVNWEKSPGDEIDKINEGLRDEYIQKEYGLTFEEFAAEMRKLTDAEQKEYTLAICDAIQDDYLDEVEKVLEDSDDMYETSEQTMVLKKINDKWLVTEIED